MEKEDFIKRLVTLRMNKGVSARDMSLSIGQSAGYINNIENGINLPSMSVFFYICEYFGITPKDFLMLKHLILQKPMSFWMRQKGLATTSWIT